MCTMYAHVCALAWKPCAKNVRMCIVHVHGKNYSADTVSICVHTSVQCTYVRKYTGQILVGITTRGRALVIMSSEFEYSSLP